MSPADPRLAELADEMAKWIAQRQPDSSWPGQESENPMTVMLLTSHAAASSPALRRLGELSQARHQAGH